MKFPFIEIESHNPTNKFQKHAYQTDVCRIHLIQFSESKNIKHNLNYIPNMTVSNPIRWMPGTISGMLMMQGIRDDKYLLTRDRGRET